MARLRRAIADWFYQRHIVARFALLAVLIFWFGVFLSFHN